MLQAGGQHLHRSECVATIRIAECNYGLAGRASFTKLQRYICLGTRWAAQIGKLPKAFGLAPAWLYSLPLIPEAIIGRILVTDPPGGCSMASPQFARMNFAQRTPFEVGQLQILEHDVDQFL